jgi:ubiquinone/menaquinone biosynthesis C-methylase UbiE
MSTYERYDHTSPDYDTTRAAVGAEIIASAMTHAPCGVSDISLLDVGCGSGNFSAALVERVGHIDAIDMSTGMLAKACSKLASAEEGGRVTFHQGDIRSLPFDNETFDAAMVNQVLHHLESAGESGYPGHSAAIAEIHRVLPPGGILTVHFCDHHQLRQGYWFYELIPQAIDAVLGRCASAAHYEAAFAGLGFEIVERIVPLELVLMGPAYFDGRGPLDPAWRNGDSIWALSPPDELSDAVAHVERLERDGELQDFIARHDAKRSKTGQFTLLVVRKPD